MSTYHTSNLNLSVHEIAFLPLHCAHPVIPGLMLCRRACSFEYKGRYLTNKGRGPMSDISPLNTLISCGNSSILVDLIHCPTLVIRTSSGNRLPSSSRSSLIVLNFIILKILASFPGRSCKKKAPAPLFARFKNSHTSNKNQLISNNTTPDTTISINRLKKCLYIIGCKNDEKSL